MFCSGLICLFMFLCCRWWLSVEGFLFLGCPCPCVCDLWLDLVPWQCSCRGTQRQLGYGSSPGISVLGKMNRVVYSQAHVSTVAPDYIKPSFLWPSSSSLALYIPFQRQLWIAILSQSVIASLLYCKSLWRQFFQTAYQIWTVSALEVFA